MDALSTFLERLKKSGKTRGHLLGMLNVVIGRRITAKDGTLISSGLTWREVAGLLKRLRWDPDQVKELGLKPSDLPPRDRQRFWYTAIARAKVDSPAAISAGNRLAAAVQPLGYVI